MTVTISGSGTIGGISVGGLNDNIITKNEMATGGAWAPAGTVLQVVQGVLSSQTALTATSFTNIFSASITPSSSTSKILVVTSVPVYAASAVNLTVFRNAVDLSNNSLGRGYFIQTVAGQWTAPIGIVYLDSPTTTSSTTYYFAAKVNSGTSYVGQDGSGNCGTITLMEIAA